MKSLNQILKTMKSVRVKLLAFSILGMLIITSCGDDDDTIATGSLEVTVNGLPSGVDASITLIDEDDAETSITSTTTLDGLTLGIYILQINAVDASGSRYVSEQDEVTVNLSSVDGESITIDYAEFSTVNGIVGTWVSTGSDVAPLLVTFFAVDSIVATFNANQTYEVLQYAGGATAPLTLSGTYAQTLSDVETIWAITVDQTAPSAFFKSVLI